MLDELKTTLDNLERNVQREEEEKKALIESHTRGYMDALTAIRQELKILENRKGKHVEPLVDDDWE